MTASFSLEPFVGAAESLRALGRADEADMVFRLVECLHVNGAMSPSHFSSALSRIKPANFDVFGNKTGDLVDALEAFFPVIEAVGEDALVKQYSGFVKDIAPFRGMIFNTFLSRLSKELHAERPLVDVSALSDVQDYVDALNATVHDDQAFPEVFERLKNDRSIFVADMREIASRFAYKVRSKTTKKQALEIIWRRHDNSRAMGAKVRAQEGKSAA